MQKKVVKRKTSSQVSPSREYTLSLFYVVVSFKLPTKNYEQNVLKYLSIKERNLRTVMAKKKETGVKKKRRPFKGDDKEVCEDRYCDTR